MNKNNPANSFSIEARKEAFRRAEASLFLSSKDPKGSSFFNEIKTKVINGELTLMNPLMIFIKIIKLR
ncbi:TPA: hypothetical protein ACIC7M_004656 [Escherichia coli]|uniref:hypothetical protein n=1 Tax=Escherichia coli TaxID=562 RepID=UPI000DD42300|nr:hypothetical protein [Escherichia coli]EHD2970708.1 hypothetical protein [Escherichia coli]